MNGNNELKETHCLSRTPTAKNPWLLRAIQIKCRSVAYDFESQRDESSMKCTDDLADIESAPQ
jgi:hypothetical protein